METLSTSSELCISSASSITRCSSYIFKKAPGYVIELEPFRGSWRAIVHDERFPGLSRSYVPSVVFEKGFKLQEFINRNAFWQSRHIHLIDKIVFFGALALKGGGLLSWFGCCDSFGCPGDLFECVCGFKCNFCYDHCTHTSTHKCSRCGSKCLLRKKCQSCFSGDYCVNCCGCYERQRQAEMLQERERQEQIRKQQERERQEQIRQQQERERQEQIRQQQERERQEQERLAVLSKLDTCLASVTIAQDHQLVSTDHSNIVSKSDQEDLYAFVSDVTAPERVAEDAADSESGWETISSINSFENCTESRYDSDSGWETISINSSNDQDIISIRSSSSPKCTQQDLLTNAPNFFETTLEEEITTCDIVSNNHSGVDSPFHKANADFHLNALQHSSGSESLLIELLSYDCDDPISLNNFRARWLMITEQFSDSEQVLLLKSLRDKRNLQNLSLFTIGCVLDFILLTGTSGFYIVCGIDENWLINLQRTWLESKVDSLSNFLVGERKELCAYLAYMDWGISMYDHFIKAVQDEVDLEPILELLKIIKIHGVPDSKVMSIIDGKTFQSENCKVVLWTHAITCQCLLQELNEVPRELFSAIELLMNKLTRSSCSVQLLNNFLTVNLSLIKAHPADFANVLSLLIDFQVTENICIAVFSLLSKETAANWIKKCDKLITEMIFQIPEVYATDELIQLIADKSSFEPIWLRNNYDAVLESYNSTSNLLKKKLLSNWNKNDVLLWAKSVKLSTCSLPELIAGVKRAVELFYRNVYSNFAIRDTQLFALLTLLNPSEGMGRLVQINTGEGKSLIVAMLAAVHALQGKKVDVITTSTELSIPEVKKQTLFFKSLSLTVAENSNSETKRKAYKSDILYGTSSDFQADILQTEFLGNDIRSNRGFSIVIVDEVDSMLFDNRSHSVRLSGQAPGMTHLELPLAAIWEHMQTTVKHLTTVKDQTFFIPDDFERVGKQITLYSGQDWKSCAVLVDDKRSFIMKHTQNHLQQLLRELNEEEKKEYEAFKKLNNEMRSLEEEISKTTNAKTKKNKQKGCELLIEQLKNLPWCQRYPVLDIPVHLYDFARSQVPFWIRNAINAAYGYKVGKHYTIQDNRIVPVHYNETGVLQSNMVWTDGLTQFLQLKEGIAMDPEGVATNFISNVSFFKRYNASIFGVTGTLGEQSTKDFMHKMYNIDTAVIPPYQHRSIADNALSSYLCKELVPIINNTEKQWFETILEKVLYHTQHRRAVLVICKFIVQVENLAKELCNRYDAKKIFTYTGEGSQFDKTKIKSGEIVLATNIAGRGKDLETSESVEEHGGLYVAVTFLPGSYRVEMQNVGRTARSGKKGMAQLIILDPLGLDIRSIKDDRDTQEHLAIEKAMDDAQNTLLQDHLFREFCGFERKHLPAVSAIWLVTKWRDLSRAWKRHSSSIVLSPKKVEKYVNHRVEERKQVLIEQSLGSLLDSDSKKINETDKQMFREKATSQAESERTYFEKEYKNKVLHDFCDAQLHVPEELLVCLKEGRNFHRKCSKFAQKYDWGLHDRKGFEEAWGFWLKAKHFEENVNEKEEALKLFHDEFASTYDKRAEEDKLVSNPYFYVLKGNTYLASDDLQSAITCYDRAICMDPAFSVNARYCKAQALLSYEENSGCRQKLAVDELKKAKEIIGTISRPALLTFSALIAQHGTKIETSNHVQYQLNLLSQQENYIDNALVVINEAQSSDFHVKLSKRPLLETLNASDHDSHKKAAREAAVNGFTHLFTVQKVEPVPWFSIAALALIAIAQIAAGCLILAYTGGTLGSTLILEGISDMFTAVKAAVRGSFDWAAWAVQKAISLAVSLICCGFQGLKNGCRAVVNTTKDLFGKAAVEATKQGVKLAARSVATALAKGVVKECLELSAQWCSNKLLDKLEKEIRERVEKTITEALLNNPLVVKALESDVKNKNDCWQQCFIKEGLSLMREETEHMCILMLRKICVGVAENKISGLTQAMQIAGVADMMMELNNYTSDFVSKFNSKVMTYKSDIESIVEQNQSNNTESTLAHETISSAPDVNIEDTDILIDSERESDVYSSKTESAGDGTQSFYIEGGPSHRGSIADVFKVEIASKLINIIRSNAVDPAINYGVKWTTDAMFKQSEKVTDDLREKVWLARERRHYSNKFSHSEQKRNKKELKRNKKKQKKKGNTHNEEQSKEKRDDSKLNKSSLKGVEKLKGDVPLDSNDLALLAAAVGSPIYVYDKESGKLVDVVGENLPGKRVTLQHEKKDGSGHWEPLNSDVNVKPSGTNNCLIDSVFEQLEPDKKRELQNATKVKEKMTEIIYNNPKEANKAYETRDRLEKIAPDSLLIGGRQPRNEDEWEKIRHHEQNLGIPAEFNEILKSKGEGIQYLGIGSADDGFKALLVKNNIKESDITSYPNGSKTFRYGNTTVTFRTDSRRNGKKTISLKEDGNEQQIVIRYEE